MRALLKIENIYEDGVEITNTVEAEITRPPEDVDSAEYDEWANEEIFPFTGTNRFAGNDEGLTYTPDAGYFVKILECDDSTLVGRTFEFGL